MLSIELEQTRTHVPAPSSVPTWLAAVRAAEDRKAAGVKVLDLREVTSFTDYFVICSGANPRQIQAIAENVLLELKRQGEQPASTEGLDGAEWVLLDYGDLIVHVFSERAREYYGLERLWRHASVVAIPPERKKGSPGVAPLSEPRSR